MIFAPFLFIYAIFFFFVLVFLFALIQVGLIHYAFEQIGLPPGGAFVALMASLLGSYVNIPLTRIESTGEFRPREIIGNYGIRYRVPQPYKGGSTMIAINVGGAIVPIIVALYVLSHRPELILHALAATAIVTLVTNRLARPIPGIGIGMPMFVPPIAAAIVAYLIAPSHPDAVAYVSGVLGTLIGADLLNLHKIRSLGAPVASIGGAGTFDGIFLTGIVAALLA
jgi:uncharacterized membrane protein